MHRFAEPIAVLVQIEVIHTITHCFLFCRIVSDDLPRPAFVCLIHAEPIFQLLQKLLCAAKVDRFALVSVTAKPQLFL